jgi:4-diphosphocytidyl-2-C-methyl-D-erythritol kinase
MRSYAKVNIGLLLLDKRNDGYHDIITVFQQIDLYDDITIEKIPSSVKITSTGFTIPLDEKNLAVKAFQLFKKKSDVQGGIRIHINKKIPVESGLGGGSSNAAVTLMTVNQLWDNKISTDEIYEIAIEIGSDVPFFIKGGTRLGQGRGEILKPIHIPSNYWVILLCPDIQINTGWAYNQSKITLTNEEKMTKFIAIFNNFSYRSLREHVKNDLESCVFKRHPVLRELKEMMYKKDAFYAGMSGSGSSIYGLFTDKKKAEAAKLFFINKYSVHALICRPIIKDV